MLGLAPLSNDRLLTKSESKYNDREFSCQEEESENEPQHLKQNGPDCLYIFFSNYTGGNNRLLIFSYQQMGINIAK